MTVRGTKKQPPVVGCGGSIVLSKFISLSILSYRVAAFKVPKVQFEIAS